MTEQINEPRTEVPKDKRGNIRWVTMEEDCRRAYIFQEARQFLSEVGDFNQKLLFKQKRTGFYRGIQLYYPGQLTQLRFDLGLSTRRPNNYWIPEQIKEEALVFQSQHGRLTGTLLETHERYDLVGAILRRYPGGLPQLRKDLQMEAPYKERGYWTNETIFSEAVEFVNKFGDISSDLLRSNGYGALDNAMSRYRYPGGMAGLRADLKLEVNKRQGGYWTPEAIKAEAVAFIQENDQLSIRTLKKRGKGSLASAIDTKYPGGWRQLRKDLGLRSLIIEGSFWTVETIEEQARLFVQEKGRLTSKHLNSKRPAFYYAIRKHYPGGIRVLREKLGISQGFSVNVISSEEANLQLERLLEERI